MITISKNAETKIVTKGAYESIFKPLGYSIVGAEEAPAVEIKDAKVEEIEEEKVEEPTEAPVEEDKAKKGSNRR